MPAVPSRHQPFQAQPSRRRFSTPLIADPLDGVAEDLIDTLSLVAEIAVGLAGFAGIAVVVGRGPGLWSTGEAIRIRFLLSNAFTALFASLIAVGTEWAGAGEPAAIRLGAGALLIGQVYWSIALGNQMRGLQASDRALFSPRSRLFFFAVTISTCAAQLVAVSGLWSQVASWLFLYGLLVCLANAAFGFVRLLFVERSSE